MNRNVESVAAMLRGDAQLCADTLSLAIGDCTLQVRSNSAAVIAGLRQFYAGSHFVRVLDAPPRVKDVATSNYAEISAVADGRTVAVMSVIDNLVKGAAGNGVQAMNVACGLPETAGLEFPGLHPV